AGASTFVGIERCSTCHVEERAFWQTTRHANAYATLSTQHKEFNLDCVGCHVTGYEKPGGSSVTHVDQLKDVQCEACHGPGSRHADSPSEPGLIARKPDLGLCAANCHHVPHVNADWRADVAVNSILGKGHGR